MADKNTNLLKLLLRSPLFTNALFMMVANVSTSLFGFVFWILVARIYSIEDVGLASAVIAASSLLVTFSGLGLQYGLIRFINSSADPVKLINSSFTVAGSVALIAGIIFVMGIGLWSPALDIVRQVPLYTAFFILSIPVFALAHLLDFTFIARRRAGFAMVKNLVFNVMRLILPFVLVLFFHSFGIFGSWGLALVTGLLVSWLFFLPKVQPGYRPAVTLDRKTAAEAIRYSFFNYLADICGTVPSNILPMLVVNILSPEDNAYFYVAWALNNIVSMVPYTISTSFMAEGSNDQSKIGQQMRRSLLLAYSMIIPAILLVFFLADKLLLLFGGAYSENATILLRILPFSAIPATLNSLFFSYKRIQKNIKPLIFINAFAGLLAIGLTYYLLPLKGISGAGIAWVISKSCISLLILVWWLRDKRQPARVP
ncbi:MAG: oligosaccharide flippase family protein [Dehalococcoidales bacterium]|nr:oligosaccharide flippase family protein [Dehalococcoidales bacterium]